MAMNKKRALGTIAEARDPRLQGLKCAYTGKPLVIRVSVSARLGALYFADGPCPGPYGNRKFANMPTMLKALSQRKGVTGAVELKESMTCPYTGAGLGTAKARDGSFSVSGGFNPYVPFRGNAEMFSTVLKGGTVEKEAEVSAAEVAPPLQEDALKDKYVEQAEQLTSTVEKAAAAPVTITVPKKTPVKRKRKSRAKGK